jgi:acetolactate synthase-1/2/3 large subunit
MRVADYIFKYLNEEAKVDTIFMVTGGGAMFLNDAIGQTKNLKYICCHHEQAATMAASAYSRYTGKLGVCVVTTGCGGTNTLTGVLGAYQDRIPMLIISGQSKVSECTYFREDNELRQLGVQEVDISKLVKSITIASFTIEKTENVKEYLTWSIEKAFEYQGPVWIDVPINIQGEEIA